MEAWDRTSREATLVVIDINTKIKEGIKIEWVEVAKVINTDLTAFKIEECRMDGFKKEEDGMMEVMEEGTLEVTDHHHHQVIWDIILQWVYHRHLQSVGQVAHLGVHHQECDNHLPWESDHNQPQAIHHLQVVDLITYHPKVTSDHPIKIGVPHGTDKEMTKNHHK